MQAERSWWRVWVLVLATLALACSCAKPDGNDTATSDSGPPVVGVYAPKSQVAASWGAFDFYGTHATLAAFQGHLALEPVGRMPPSSGEELAGAQVYRIVNWQEYHEQNGNRDMRCLRPARWLAIKTQPKTAAEPVKLWVALLMLEDWAAYVPMKPGFCGGGLYEAN